MPPIAAKNDATAYRASRRPWPASSLRYPTAPVMLPVTRPIALDVVAVTGGYPSATRTGKVTSVPEPTTALISPAHTPARAMIAASHHRTAPR